jgi:hypothetical protein
MNENTVKADSIVTGKEQEKALIKKYGKEFSSREMWLDFETWLYKNHGLTIPNLSWNAYIQYSKAYNNERKNA